MKIEVKKSFEKDVNKITNADLAKSVLQLIADLEVCQDLKEIPHIKKMSGKGSYYRIRIGDYRRGLKFAGEHLILLRFMNRKDIYKYFP